MSYENKLFEEIQEKITTLMERNEPIRANWIAHSICQNHEAGLSESGDCDFWKWTGYRATRDCVRRCISKRLDNSETKSSPQITLPGFEHLQTHYLITRQGEDVGVPVNEITKEEFKQKASQYRAMGAACYAHADEIDRYCEMRDAGVA